MDRKPNSHECIYFGRKLSNICCDDIEVTEGYVVIGSVRDDQIYFDKNHLGELILSESALRERVKIICINDSEEFLHDGWCFEIDLEDVLRFAMRNCRSLYMRVLREEYKRNFV